MSDLKARIEWERRQAVFYKLRHGGVNRKNPPYPGAANLHFPLCDSIWERMKSFYVQQLYGTDTFASFVSEKPQQDALSTAAACWFDYRLKQKSNFEEKTMAAIDYMGMSGRGVLKLYWSNKYKKLCFESVDPLYFIVPPTANSLEDADRVVHVLHMSEDAYRRNDNFANQTLATDSQNEAALHR